MALRPAARRPAVYAETQLRAPKKPTSASEAWELETSKKPRERKFRMFQEIGEAVAREPGRFEHDPDEARLVVEDLHNWWRRDEFDRDDVLVLTVAPPYFIPVYLHLDSTPSAEERNNREQELNTFPLVNFLVLRRRGTELYLRRCRHQGAPRVLDDWGFDAREQERILEAAAADTSAKLTPPVSKLRAATKDELRNHTPEALAQVKTGRHKNWRDKDKDLVPLVQRRLRTVGLRRGRDAIRPYIDEVLKEKQENSQDADRR